MSLKKLKKDELIELAKANGLEIDPEGKKADILELIKAAGIEMPEETEADSGEGYGPNNKHVAAEAAKDGYPPNKK